MKANIIMITCFLGMFGVTNNVVAQVQSVVAVGAFAIGINQLSDRANQIIQQAQESGLLLEVNGGAQVLNLISQAKEAYANELKSTAQTMTSQQQQLLSGLSGILNDIQNHVLKDLESNLQRTANIVPFSKTFPQLTSYKGATIPPNLTDNIILTLYGNFFDLANKDYDASLNIGESTFVNSTKETGEITFKISKKGFEPSDNKVLYKNFSVNIPYKKNVLFFGKKSFATFTLDFIVLPKNAGTYEVISTKAVSVRKTENVVCGGLVWDSATNDDESTKGCNMENGWICDRNSVAVTFSRKEGGEGASWWNRGNQSTPTYVGWKFRTERHHTGTSGKLTVDLHYTKYKDVIEQQSISGGIIPLSWGDTKAVTLEPTATWKIIYHEFDGKTLEYVASDETNPYLKIKSFGNQIQIKAMP